MIQLCTPQEYFSHHVKFTDSSNSINLHDGRNALIVALTGTIKNDKHPFVGTLSTNEYKYIWGN